MAILLKTALVRVSSIQIMQIRGKIVAKVFGKVDTFWTYQLVMYIRLVGDASTGTQQSNLETQLVLASPNILNYN